MRIRRYIITFIQMSGYPLKGGPKLVTPEFFFSDPKKGPKMGSKVPYLIERIARNGNIYLPCDFEPDWWRVNFRENFQGGYPLQIFTKIDPSQIWLKIAGKVVYAISSNSTNKIGYFWAHFGSFFGVGKYKNQEWPTLGPLLGGFLTFVRRL